MKAKFKAYEIDDDKKRLQYPQLEAWLSKTYWSPRIRQKEIRQGVKHSTLALGCYKKDEQVGFLRLVSDRTRFAYFMDVYVDTKHRKKGIAERMMKFAMGHKDFKDVYLWLLATRDAHGVYRKVGFKALKNPGAWMLRKMEKNRQARGLFENTGAKKRDPFTNENGFLRPSLFPSISAHLLSRHAPPAILAPFRFLPGPMRMPRPERPRPGFGGHEGRHAGKPLRGLHP